MCVGPLLGPPMEKQQEKTYKKTTLFVILSRLIIFALNFFFGYPLLFKVAAVAGKVVFHPFDSFEEYSLWKFFQRQPIQNDMHSADDLRICCKPFATKHVSWLGTTRNRTNQIWTVGVGAAPCLDPMFFQVFLHDSYFMWTKDVVVHNCLLAFFLPSH